MSPSFGELSLHYSNFVPKGLSHSLGELNLYPKLVLKGLSHSLAELSLYQFCLKGTVPLIGSAETT